MEFYILADLIKLQPDKLVVEFGAPATANCSTTSIHFGMGWEASEGPVDSKEDVQFITWSVDSLTHWNIEPICFINLKHDQSEAILPVLIYSESYLSCWL